MFQSCLHEYACDVMLIYCMPSSGLYMGDFSMLVASLLLSSVPFLKLLYPPFLYAGLDLPGGGGCGGSTPAVKTATPAG